MIQQKNPSLIESNITLLLLGAGAATGAATAASHASNSDQNPLLIWASLIPGKTHLQLRLLVACTVSHTHRLDCVRAPYLPLCVCMRKKERESVCVREDAVSGPSLPRHRRRSVSLRPVLRSSGRAWDACKGKEAGSSRGVRQQHPRH